MQNRKMHKNNKSGYKGVYFDRSKNRPSRFVAQIRLNGKKYRARYKTLEEAAIGYNNLAKTLFGEFALLNVL